MVVVNKCRVIIVDPAPVMRRSGLTPLSKARDLLREQRSRVEQALNNDEAKLKIEYTIKEKNRRLLALEGEKRTLVEEMGVLRERAVKAENALVATQNGARTQVRELIEQRQSLQQRVQALERGLGGELSLLDSLMPPAPAPAKEDDMLRQTLEQAQERVATLERDMASRTADWDSAKARAVGQLKALHEERGALSTQVERLQHELQQSQQALVLAQTQASLAQARPPSAGLGSAAPNGAGERAELEAARHQLQASQAETAQQRAQSEAMRAELRAALERAAGMERELSSRTAEWDAAKARAVAQLKALQAEKASLASQVETLQLQGASGTPTLGFGVGGAAPVQDASAVAAAQASAQAAQASAQAAQAQAEQQRREVDRLNAELTALRAQSEREAQAAHSSTRALTEELQQLRHAAAVAAPLAAAHEAQAHDAARAASLERDEARRQVDALAAQLSEVQARMQSEMAAAAARAMEAEQTGRQAVERRATTAEQKASEAEQRATAAEHACASAQASGAAATEQARAAKEHLVPSA